MKKTLLLCWAALLVSLSACEISDPDYSADMLLPLVKTRIKPENVNDLGEIVFKQDIVIPDVSHIFNVAFPVPAFQAQNVGPIPLVDEENAFVRAKVDTAEYELTIINNFPINIKAGTTVEITNTTNNDIVFTAVLPEDIPPYGGEKVITLFLSQTSPWFDNDLRLYLRNFSSDGSNGQPVDFNTNNNIRLRFDINLVRINEVEVNQGKNYFLQDTVDFNVQDEDNFANLAEGKLTLFVENGWPAGYRFQGYFLDDQYQIVDSLLELTEVPAPELNNQGYVIPSSVQEVKLETIWTREELLRLRNQAKYLSFRARFQIPTPTHLPPTQTIKLRHENQVGLQLVGDLKVEVNP